MKPRNVEQVLTQIIDILPDTGEAKDLKDNLQRIIRDSRYRAPELMYLSWRDAYEELINTFMEGDKLRRDVADLGLEVFEIFSTKSKAELKANIYPEDTMEGDEDGVKCNIQRSLNKLGEIEDRGKSYEF